MIKEAIGRLVQGVDLTLDEAEAVTEEIMTGLATPGQLGAFLVALRMKGETIDEVTGCAQVMRRHATRVKAQAEDILDTCGTGGDGAHTFNISTIAAFVACGAGATVAKHGNRSVSSKCGSADLLKQLGVNIEVGVDVVERCLKEIGIGFLFAPLLHGAMKYATPVRREIGVRTIFNILGPLTNPAGAGHQLLGVYDEALTEVLAKVLGNLGSVHALVVHGLDGLDEITTTSPTQVSELNNGEVRSYRIKPTDFGIELAEPEQLKGGDPEYNAKVTIEVLEGKKGPRRDVVLLNAGAAIYAADLSKDIKEGVELAARSIDSARALEKLGQLRDYTNVHLGGVSI